MSTSALELESVKARLSQMFADNAARGAACQKAGDAGYAAWQISNDIQERFGISRSIDEIIACLDSVKVNPLTRKRRISGVLELAGVPVNITAMASRNGSFKLTYEDGDRDVSHPGTLILSAS